MKTSRHSLESHAAEEIVVASQQLIEAAREAEDESGRRRLEIDRMHQQQVDSFQLTGRSEVEQLETEYAQRKAAADAEYQSERQQVQAAYSAELSRIQREYDAELASVQRQFEESEWMLESIHDSSSDENPQARYESFATHLKSTRDYLQTQWSSLESLYKSMTDTLRARRQPVPTADELEQAAINDPAVCVERIEAGLQQVERRLRQLQSQWLGTLFAGARPVLLAVGLFIISWAAVAAARTDLAEILSEPDRVDWAWVGVAAGCAAGVTLIVELSLLMIARTSAARVSQAVVRAVQEARWAMTEWKRTTSAQHQLLREQSESWQRDVAAHRQRTLERAEMALNQRRDELNTRREQQIQAAHGLYTPRLQQLDQTHQSCLETLDYEYPTRIAAAQQSLDRQAQAIDDNYQRQLDQWRHESTARRAELADDWRTVTGHALQQLQRRQEDLERTHLAWQQLSDAAQVNPVDLPNGIQLGRMELNPLQLLDESQRQWAAEHLAGLLGHDLPTVDVPAALPFPGNPSLVIRSDGSGRRQADAVLKLAMLRMLALFPPGKLRFTVIDPVSLGENFAGFMHLADHDEQLIGSRIWTESSQIEKRLALLTEHMENVFQSYLRNEFETIQQYNEHAGEVAEPYQVLVVAGFPTNFSEPAMRRIQSIATSGERCGVYLLMSVDERIKLPPGLERSDLEQQATVVEVRGDQMVWDQPVLRKLALQLDELPAGDVLSSVVRRIGQASKHTRRVEVAFDRVAPRNGELWKSSSRTGIDIPLGRAGATKLQHLALGQGTAQHVLVAGKTGSGKTTFLHTLITNVALHYSPREVEFYLIDFKKGVEFKTYAASKLPHARVIAIESDREFGLSVLERLDGLLKERGDLFREAGVPDLPTWRDRFPDADLPRVLLIVDEFQEFFVEDDRVGQDAALYLDRLVRQGRAFGIHVLLGSQTLSGAYSLARSTLGQVAVRIALQCSETDAHLILSEENTAARLLSRPGEAIYNDANGLVEGNHPFQVAYLPDEQRDKYLGQIAQQSRMDQLAVEPPVVFEGHLPAELSANVELNELIEAEVEDVPREFRVWLGDAVSIKEPTCAVFSSAAGRNLLICGAHSAAASGMLEAIAISLSAQLPRFIPDSDPVPFVVLDGTAEAGLEPLFDVLPQPSVLCGPDQATAAIDDLYDDLQARLTAAPGEIDSAPRFVFVASLGRFRDLRKGDDDYGFGGYDSDPQLTTAQKFAELLKSGPTCGLYTIVWSDSFSNLMRWMSVTMLREFELRVGLQMNSSDSSQLFDSPVAGQLGPHRCVLFTADEGTQERFRPYRSTDEVMRDALRSRLGGTSNQAGVASDLDDWTVL